MLQKRVGAIIFVLWVMMGCGPNFVDATKVNQPKKMSTPLGRYSHVAWLTDRQLAFLYAPSLDSATPGEDSIIIYKLDTEEWHELTIEKPDTCFSTKRLRLNRLPNNQLSFLHRCYRPDDHITIYTLYMWDPATDKLQVLQHYPERFFASSFTFAPDMSELIQQEDGGGLEDKLFRVSKDGQLQQLFSDYLRVRSASWSPDGSTIAFVGTKIVLQRDFGSLHADFTGKIASIIKFYAFEDGFKDFRSLKSTCYVKISL